ncbi:MAG: hypothetical protein AMS14_05635 [Planctomycetes bacterium DG_20]|nr:MAG: hypothetical protein AMS14_05635 [Planctomycetes bacterium DG_20]
MKRWTILVAFLLVAALAGARGVWGTPTGVSPGPAAALPSSESAAAPKPAEANAEAATDAAADAAAAYKARQEAALKAKEFARTRRTLTSTMRSRPGIDFERTSVKNVLMYLGEVGNFGIVFDKALEEAGIDLEARTVSIRVSRVSYEKAIELVLPRECGYRVGPGYVLITTLEKSWLPLRTATYSIRLALAQVPDFTDAPRFEVGDVLQSATSAAGGGGFGELFGGGATTTTDQDQATPDRIIELIQKFVRNENDRHIAPWADEGGPATITYLGGQLIITQTDHGHQAVRKLLSMIE